MNVWAVVTLLWIKLLAFTLLHALAILHGKLVRLGCRSASHCAEWPDHGDPAIGFRVVLAPGQP